MALATTHGNNNKINSTGYDFSSKYWKHWQKWLVLSEHKVFLIFLFNYFFFCGFFFIWSGFSLGSFCCCFWFVGLFWGGFLVFFETKKSHSFIPKVKVSEARLTSMWDTGRINIIHIGHSPVIHTLDYFLPEAEEIPPILGCMARSFQESCVIFLLFWKEGKPATKDGFISKGFQPALAKVMAQVLQWVFKLVLG